MKSFVACSAVALVGLVALADYAQAMKAYLAYIPNGSLFSQELGHPGNDSSKYTDFATAFEAVGLSWTAAFCADTFPNSDMTNGAAFGDPCCTWSKGGSPDFTVTPFTTDPTTATVCATTSSTSSPATTSPAATTTSIVSSAATSPATTAPSAITTAPSTTTTAPSTTTMAPSTTTTTPTTTTTAPSTTTTTTTTTTAPSTIDSTTGGDGCHAKPHSGPKSGKSGLRA